MKANGYNMTQLADATNDHYPNLSRFLSYKRAISESFKWRFSRAFGDAARDEVFPPTPVVEPA
jgi:hypothetical protein